MDIMMSGHTNACPVNFLKGIYHLQVDVPHKDSMIWSFGIVSIVNLNMDKVLSKQQVVSELIRREAHVTSL